LLLLLLPWFGCCQASAGGVQSPCDLVSCLLGPPAPLHLHLDGTHSTLVCGGGGGGGPPHGLASKLPASMQCCAAAHATVAPRGRP
jgi:hypothetical protein